MGDATVLTNAPYFTHSHGSGFQEVWYMKLNDVASGRALWLRLTVLQRMDKSKEIAEVWAIFFERDNTETKKVAIKNTWPIAEFKADDTEGLHIAHTCLLAARTEGHVHDDAHSLRWDFSFSPRTNAQFDFVPALLPRLKVVKNKATTVHEDLCFDGWCEVDGVRYDWAEAPGMQGHLAGPRNGHSWAWGHCNCFVDDATAAPAPVVWDGLCARAPLGRGAAPPLTSMFFQIGNERYEVNTLRDAFRTRAQYDYDGFTFRVSKRGTVFEGRVSARLADYAGVTYEDTDGSHLYCHNSKISDMTLRVLGSDGTDNTYSSTGGVAYEVVSRQPHPEVPLLL